MGMLFTLVQIPGQVYGLHWQRRSLSFNFAFDIGKLNLEVFRIEEFDKPNSR